MNPSYFVLPIPENDRLKRVQISCGNEDAMMKARIQQISLIFLTFAVTGWGNLYAATNCPLMGFAPPPIVRKSPEQAKPRHHCHPNMESAPAVPPRQSSANPGRAERSYTAEAARFSNDTQCVLCVMGGESPVRSAAKSETSKPEIEPVMDETAAFRAPSYTDLARVQLRSGAPPGSSLRIHLLLNVFLI
jgi:hypothetical protein